LRLRLSEARCGALRLLWQTALVINETFLQPLVLKPRDSPTHSLTNQQVKYERCPNQTSAELNTVLSANLECGGALQILHVRV
jgi:hypothetical protein